MIHSTCDKEPEVLPFFIQIMGYEYNLSKLSDRAWKTCFGASPYMQMWRTRLLIQHIPEKKIKKKYNILISFEKQHQ